MSITIDGGGPGLVYLEILGEPYKLVSTGGDNAERAARYLVGIEAEALAARGVLAPDGAWADCWPSGFRKCYAAARAANESEEG